MSKRIAEQGLDYEVDGGESRRENRRIQLRMLRRAVYLHALNYGRSRSSEDRKAIVSTVAELDALRRSSR